jgi:enoyl-CoA hydratase
MNIRAFPLSIDSGVALLTLNRPFCLDIAGKHELSEAMESLQGRNEVRALIIASASQQAFLVNVAELADMRAEDAAAFSAAGHTLAAAIEALQFPVIAAVEGPALGGGCELVAACDLAVAGGGATFGQIEGLGGVMPAFGGCWRLARRVGYQRALEMMFTAAVITAQTAKAYGLVLDTVPAGKAVDAAMALAKRVVPLRAASVAAIKSTALFGRSHAPAEIDALEERQFAALFGNEQSQRMHAYLKQQVK